jgi:CTP:molybdopterin cytidylyltransferase MocA
MTARAPHSVVLLAAGRGSRLAELTVTTHKSLLPVGGRPSLGFILDVLLAAGTREIVVVKGYMHEAIESYVATFPEAVRVVNNLRYAEDTNILSTAIGVDALTTPEAGYMIVETDLVVAPSGWRAILDVGDARSFWVTRGTYGPSLTGGALHADASGEIEQIVYAPVYDQRYDGWDKLLGVLYVGPNETAKDRELRAEAARRSIAQYYMAPWTVHLAELPCRVRPLGDTYAASFNDLATYRAVDDAFSALLRSEIPQ